jgi:integrase
MQVQPEQANESVNPVEVMPVDAPVLLTVGQFLRDWLQETARPRVRRSTYRNYESVCRLHLQPALGSIPLAQLRPEQVDRFLMAKLAAGFAPATVELIRSVLRRALGVAVRWDYIPRNAAAMVDPPAASTYSVPLPDPSTVRALFEAIRGHPLYAMYLLAFNLGLRSGELRGLRWQDVDFFACLVSVRQTAHQVDGGHAFLPPKTRRAERTLPLPAIAAAALLEHRERQRRQRESFPHWEDWGLCFTTPKGRPINGPAAVKAFQRLLASKGLPRMRLHDLRHICATMMLAEGVELAVVSRILGHSSIALTFARYAGILPSLTQDAVQRMERVLRAA